MLLLWKKNTVNTDWGGGGKQTFLVIFSTVFHYILIWRQGNWSAVSGGLPEEDSLNIAKEFL